MSDLENVVVMEGVKKDYKVKGRSMPVRALRGVDMEIKRGAMVAIKGPSGSGKTTLLQMIGALDVPTSGAAKVNGINLSDMSEAELTEYRAKTIGFVFQIFNLLPNLTALENVELPMEALNVPKEERRKRALKLLKAVGMSQRGDYKPLKLSGGEQQRIAIARALANEPDIILADEPTGNLDSKSGASIVSLLNKLRIKRGTTVIIVTHSGKAARECEKTFTISDGVITSTQLMEKKSRIENQKKKLRIALSASGKIVTKLFSAGYETVESLEGVSVKDLTEILGNKNKAEKIAKKVTLLKELREDTVD
jgi:putative ABC transport system ATP-binding protein